MSDLRINWSGDRKGNGQVIYGDQTLPVAIPKEFQGSGEGFGPKELLAASAATCFYTTLLHLVEVRKLPVISFDMATEITNGDKNLEIYHEPKLVLSTSASAEDKAAAERAIDSADKTCAVGNILKTAGIHIQIQKNITIPE
ncbi:OsmC family protein [Tetragenococcus halophilus]|nr:OsmC family protein [Tetragenococcus halophilus]